MARRQRHPVPTTHPAAPSRSRQTSQVECLASSHAVTGGTIVDGKRNLIADQQRGSLALGGDPGGNRFDLSARDVVGLHRPCVGRIVVQEWIGRPDHEGAIDEDTWAAGGTRRNRCGLATTDLVQVHAIVGAHRREGPHDKIAAGAVSTKVPHRDSIDPCEYTLLTARDLTHMYGPGFTIP